MRRLDENFDKNTVKLIRMKHPCGIPKDYNKKILEVKEETNDPEKK